MIHPSTRVCWCNDEKGHGVVATERIPAGTITWVMDPLDRVFDAEALAAIPPATRGVMDTYCYRDREGRHVLCWDHTRYMNHSFRPTCMSPPYGFELAIRDIEAGGELTNDYGTLNILEPFRPVDEGTERNTVYPDDPTRHHREWDRQLRAAFDRLDNVPQPLRAWLSDELWDTCLRVARRQEPMRSIRSCAMEPDASV